jgi:dynactin 1
VELDDACGKNDGSAKGERYFDCAACHGLFVRADKLAVVEQAQHE